MAVFAQAHRTLHAQNAVLKKLKPDIMKIRLLNGGITPVKIVVMSGLSINNIFDKRQLTYNKSLF